jgi:hypothetical protein
VDLERGAVEKALWEERSLVKTWAMRGTLHLLPAAEFPRWQAALGTFRHYLRESWLRYFGVTAEEMEQLLTAVAQALDGRMLTREELGREVARLTGSEDLGKAIGGSWGTLLKPVAYRGHLCFAPCAGQNVRFTRTDQWLRRWWQEDPDLAFAEITRRYLATYGPATRDDFAQWWGMSVAGARKLLHGLGAEATVVDVEGTHAVMLSEDVQQATNASVSRSVQLLPGFDQYVLGASRHLLKLLPGPFTARISRQAGWISPVLLVNGRMDGVWRHERKGRRLNLTIETLVKVPVWARRAAEEEASRLAAFTGGELSLTWV